MIVIDMFSLRVTGMPIKGNKPIEMPTEIIKPITVLAITSIIDCLFVCAILQIYNFSIKYQIF